MNRRSRAPFFCEAGTYFASDYHPNDEPALQQSALDRYGKTYTCLKTPRNRYPIFPSPLQPAKTDLFPAADPTISALSVHLLSSHEYEVELPKHDQYPA